MYSLLWHVYAHCNALLPNKYHFILESLSVIEVDKGLVFREETDIEN